MRKGFWISVHGMTMTEVKGLAGRRAISNAIAELNMRKFLPKAKALSDADIDSAVEAISSAAKQWEVGNGNFPSPA